MTRPKAALKASVIRRVKKMKRTRVGRKVNDFGLYEYVNKIHILR